MKRLIAELRAERLFSKDSCLAIFLLLQLSLPMLVVPPQTVYAFGTIVIRADGSVDPPEVPISNSGNAVYTFTDNISVGAVDGIVIMRDNIVLDGNGFTLQGSGSGTGKGIYLPGRENVTVLNIHVKFCSVGIYLSNSSGNTISRNVVTDNYGGIWVFDSSCSNTIYANDVWANFEDCICLSYSSSHNKIIENSVRSDTHSGIQIDTGCCYNIISGNNATNGFIGILLSVDEDNNTIIGNTLAQNYYGIYLNSPGSDNAIYNNNFVNNYQQVWTGGSSAIWDAGYPSGGNYWSNYAGVDVKNGIHQDQPGSDGIGDTARVIDSSNQDNYPLMEPLDPSEEHSIKVLHVSTNMNNEVQRIVNNVSAADLFTITQISLTDFNAGAASNLSEYDVIVFGVNNEGESNGPYAGPYGRTAQLKSYVELGGGIVWTHDTLEYFNDCGENIEKPAGVDNCGDPWVGAYGIPNARILHDHPVLHGLFEIGDVGDLIPKTYIATHNAYDHSTGGRVTTAEIIIEHEDTSSLNNFYLTVNEYGMGRVALDVIGDAMDEYGLNLESTRENQILVNAIWWVAGVSSDLAIANIDPIQVVENTKALIVNKKTAMQVDILSSYSQVTIPYIDVYYDSGNRYREDGENGLGLTIENGLYRIYVPGGPIFREQNGEWHQYKAKWKPTHSAGWDFFLKWTSTGSGSDNKIKAEIPYLSNEADPSNNAKNLVKKIVDTRSLKVLVVPTYFPSIGQSPFSPNTNNQRDFLKEILPIQGELLHWKVMPAIPNLGTPGQDPPALSMEDWFYFYVALPWEATAKVFGYDRVVIVLNGFSRYTLGWDGKAIGMGRWPEDPMTVFVRNEGLAGWEGLVAHEIGHTYYLWHPNKYGGYGPDIEETRRYRLSTRSYEDTVPDLMNNTLYDIVWIDKERYCSDAKQWIQINPSIPFIGTYRWNLLEQFMTEPDPEVLVTFGAIFRNGTAETGLPWFRTNGTPNLFTGNTGNYSWVLLDSGHQPMEEYRFNATFSYLTEINGSMVERESDMIPFFFTIPISGTIRYVELRDASQNILATKVLSENVPTVNLLSPEGNATLRRGSNCFINWTAADADGDPLIFVLAYSPDCGDSWIPLSAGLSQSSFEWNTCDMEPGNGYLVKVIVSDGMNTGEDISDSPFEIQASDVAVLGVSASKTVVGERYGTNITVTAQNQGNFTEVFNVTTYGNFSTTGVLSFDLVLGSIENKTCVWNTTGFAYGNYTLIGAGDVIFGEIDVSDNNYTCSVSVHVGVPGDITGPTVGVYDGTTNMRDVQYLILHFNTNPSSPNWNPNADINNDATVNMRDIQIAILNFNKHE